MGKWSFALKTMQDAKKNYLSGDDSAKNVRSVHQTLLLRALIILKDICPETEQLFSPMMKTMMQYVKKPDKKGDYQNGMGMHYYCPVNSSGYRLGSVEGYYRNGLGSVSRSARTMFEESYTMALTFGYAGFGEQSAKQLARAVHMISDMCCLPHVTGLTYFSSKKNIHVAYEELAELMYPDFIEHQFCRKLPALFSSRSGFEKSVNKIVDKTAKEKNEFLKDPVAEIRKRLLETEICVASLLMRFYEDLNMDGYDAHYIVTGDECRLSSEGEYVSAKITKDGVFFHGVNPFPQSALNMTRTAFYVAHRHDGLYTISPAEDKSGRVAEVSGEKRVILRPFSPVRKEQLFKL